MLLLLPVVIIILAAIAVLVMNQFKLSLGYIWLVAVLSSFTIWILLFAINWDTVSGLNYPFIRLVEGYDLRVIFDIDQYSWPYVFGLAGLLTGVLLTASVRFQFFSTPKTWAASLAIAAAGLISVMSTTPLALVLTWTLLDLVEWAILVALEPGNSLTRRTLLAFMGRFTGSFMVIAAMILGSQHGYMFQFDNMVAPESTIFLLAVALRLGLIPLNVPFAVEPIISRGLGTLIRLIPPVAALAALGRLPQALIPPQSANWVFLFVVLAAGFGAWNWLISRDDLVGRSFWFITLSGLAMASTIRGQSVASSTWGITMLLVGGLVFLFNERRGFLAYIPLAGLLGMTGLPFTPGANGLFGLSVLPFNAADIVFIVVFALLLAGTGLKLFRKGEEVPELERWMLIVYGVGLGVIVLTYWMIGIFGPATWNIVGIWWVSLISLAIASAIVAINRFWVASGLARIIPNDPRLVAGRKISKKVSDFLMMDWLYTLFGGLLVGLRAMNGFFLRVIEGEGGVLWTFLLVLLLASLAATRG